MGITRPRPDGGVTRKAPGTLDPAVILPPYRVEDMFRSLKIRGQDVKREFHDVKMYTKGSNVANHAWSKNHHVSL